MNKRNIYITAQDMDRLRNLLRTTKDPFGMDRATLGDSTCRARSREDCGTGCAKADVVTMNSIVRVRDRESDRTTLVTLVFPERANPETNCISVIAPLGAALLGYRVGDRISFKVPTGVRTCEIVEVVYQPEAAGDLHL